MNLTLIIIYILLTATVGLSIVELKNNIDKKKKKREMILEYDECLNIINETIKREYNFRLKLEYQLKDLKMIYDFEKDLREIVKSVMISFNEEFIHCVEFYHRTGYVTSYVTRTVELLLMDYTQKNKIKTR